MSTGNEPTRCMIEGCFAYCMHCGSEVRQQESEGTPQISESDSSDVSESEGVVVEIERQSGSSAHRITQWDYDEDDYEVLRLVPGTYRLTRIQDDVSL